MAYVAELYVDTVNIIHFMHDKYAYEASQFVLHDTNLERIATYGIAGPSIAADSLSAIKYATVKPIRNENGVAIDFETIGDFLSMEMMTTAQMLLEKIKNNEYKTLQQS